MQKIVVVSASYSQLLMVEVLLQSDYSVAILATAQQLDAELKAGKPDLILMDVTLPGKNGFEACRDIKTNDRFRQMPVILCLDIDRESDKFWAKQQGASGTLVKPLNKEDLLAMVKHNLPP